MNANAGCIRPGATRPEDIMAHADGQASAGFAEHIRSCPHCAAEVQGLARAQHRLQRVLSRFDCPPAQELGDYELDLISSEERTRIAAHVVQCPRCTEDLQQLRAFLAEPVEPVEPSVLPFWDRLPRFFAIPFVPTPTAAATLRGAADEEATRTYRADGVAITLNVQPDTRGKATLAGLLMYEGAAAEEASGGEAHLTAADSTITSTEIDELGNFVFDGVTPGPYQLELLLPDRTVVIEDLQV